jgi:broad specificity phosphatase PhoE
MKLFTLAHKMNVSQRLYSTSLHVCKPAKFSSAAMPMMDYGFEIEEEVEDDTPRVSAHLPDLAPNTRRVYLLRHGETDWNKAGKIQGGGFDIPLNENGRNQARSAASALDDIPLSLIASSPLSRAAETADMLTHGRDGYYERVLVPGLTEMSFGEFEGFPRRRADVCPDLKARYHRIDSECNEDPTKAFPGGESAAMVAERATAAFFEMLDQFSHHQHIALVCHSRLNRILISDAFLKDVKQFPHVQQGNSCINAIDIHEDGTTDIKLLNFIEHVEGTIAPDSNV